MIVLKKKKKDTFDIFTVNLFPLPVDISRECFRSLLFLERDSDSSQLLVPVIISIYRL